MPPFIRVTHSWTPKSGILRDAAMNSFVFDVPSGSVDSHIMTFYNSLATYLSPVLGATANAVLMKHFDITSHLNGSPAGPPISSATLTPVTGGSGSPLPNEVSAVISYHGDYSTLSEHVGTSRPRARARGRLYVGPLNNTGLTSDGTTSQPHLNGTFTADLIAAFKALCASENLGVWSRKDAQVRVVVGGWVDNEWDSQRRRGATATARSTFSLP